MRRHGILVVSPVRVGNEISGTAGFLLDITDRKQAEERLAYQAHVLENVHDAIVATGPDQPEERLVQVVEMLWFAGLSVEEAAEATGSSPSTVKRDWRKARALLHAILSSDGGAVR